MLTKTQGMPVQSAAPGVIPDTVTGPNDETLVQSGSFPSHEQAKQAARIVRAGDPRPTYTCPECGHVLRISGLGRHRVYFELSDERSDDPVMNRVCPACEHGLPGKNQPTPAER